jgi:hypothetical protein
MIAIAKSCYTDIVRSGVVAVTGLEHKPSRLTPVGHLFCVTPLARRATSAADDTPGSVVYQHEKTPTSVSRASRGTSAQEQTLC